MCFCDEWLGDSEQMWEADELKTSEVRDKLQTNVWLLLHAKKHTRVTDAYTLCIKLRVPILQSYRLEQPQHVKKKYNK